MGASALIEPLTLVLSLMLLPMQPPGDVDYALGKIGVPPVSVAANPIRLVDLEATMAAQRTTSAAFKGRVKLGARAFAGGEANADRAGGFIDTQRLGFGITTENDLLDLEASLRAPFFLIDVDAERRDDMWSFAGVGSVRFGTDWEALGSYTHDTNEQGGGPPSLEEFIDSGRLPPPGLPTRALRSGSLGFLYQRENHFELESHARVSRIRTEAGFELTERDMRSRVLWNRLPFELDGSFELARTGRVRRTESRAELGAALRIGGHVLATARTTQEWQFGVERSFRVVRAGLTFFTRRYRFARSSELATQTLALARRANALGYNERRVYDDDGLRAFSERLSISSAHRELASAIDELYRARIAARNVPTLGFELERATNELENSTTRGYRAFVGVPWPVSWPGLKREASVEFIRLDFSYDETRFASLALSQERYEVTATIELTREHIVIARWTDPGQSPEDIALRIDRPRRFVVDYVYALGR